MITYAGYALLRPYWFAAILLVIGLAIYMRTRGGLGDWRKAIDPALMAAMEKRGLIVGDEKRKRPSYVVIALALLALALTGPALRRPLGDSYRNLDGIIVAFDLSRSIDEGGGLSTARSSALEAIQAAGTRQVAVMVYAGDAYMAANFTADRQALGPIIAALEPGLVVESGSDVEAALKLAASRFKEANIIGGDVVLVTDGGGINERARNEAAKLAAAGFRVDILFVDGPTLPAGAPKPDDASAARMAAMTNGVFASSAEPTRLAEALADNNGERVGRSNYIVLGWIDLGRWMLVLAAVPILLLFRRRA